MKMEIMKTAVTVETPKTPEILIQIPTMPEMRISPAARLVPEKAVLRIPEIPKTAADLQKTAMAETAPQAATAPRLTAVLAATVETAVPIAATVETAVPTAPPPQRRFLSTKPVG